MSAHDDYLDPDLHLYGNDDEDLSGHYCPECPHCQQTPRRGRPHETVREQRVRYRRHQDENLKRAISKRAKYEVSQTIGVVKAVVQYQGHLVIEDTMTVALDKMFRKIKGR